jgi:hypothetical protein
MTEREPTRWMDAAAQADPALRDALRIVSAERPSSAQVQALADQVLGSLAQGTAAGASAVAWKATWLKLGASVLAMGVVALGGVLWQRAPVPAPESSRVSASTQAVAAPAQGTPPAAMRVPVEPSSVAAGSSALPHQVEQERKPGRALVAMPARDVPARAAAARKARPARARGSATHPATVPHDGVKHASAPHAQTPPELALLEQAQRAITHAPARTLALLARHRELYPRGEFAEEREVLGLDALQRLRWDAQLRDKAREFVERYPGSLHVVRVRRLLHDAE